MMMMRLQPVLSGIAILVSFAQAWSHVSTDALREALEVNELTLVAFVSPHQERSKALEPTWEAAASQTANGALLSLDCETEPAICDEFAVKAFPTIQLFKKETPSTVYQGPKRAAAIQHFLARQSRPPVTTIPAAGLEAFRSIDETVLVAYLDPSDEQTAQAFAEVAARHRDEFTFGLVTDASALRDLSIEPPRIVCHRTLDGATATVDPSADADALQKDVLDASRPYISELTPLNQQRLIDRAWPIIYLLHPTEAGQSALRASLLKFATSYHDSLTAVLASPLDHPDLPAKLGLGDNASYPAGAVHQLSKDRVYPYPRGRALDPQSVQKWGLDVYQGRVKPWTPPGVTTSYDDLGPVRVGTRRVSVASGWPGVKVKIAGHDEL